MTIVKEAEEKSLINLKVTKSELKALKANAKKYAKGNLSLWLRHAGIFHKPTRKSK